MRKFCIKIRSSIFHSLDYLPDYVIDDETKMKYVTMEYPFCNNLILYILILKQLNVGMFISMTLTQKDIII